jgi:hypothetical protein
MTEVPGTRIPDVSMDGRRGWERWDVIHEGVRIMVAPIGAYMRVLSEGRHWAWYIRDPNGDASSIHREHHAVAEHDDGSITVSPSIVVTHGGRWHGYLRRGIWSPV